MRPYLLACCVLAAFITFSCDDHAPKDAPDLQETSDTDASQDTTPEPDLHDLSDPSDTLEDNLDLTDLIDTDTLADTSDLTEIEADLQDLPPDIFVDLQDTADQSQDLLPDQHIDDLGDQLDQSDQSDAYTPELDAVLAAIYDDMQALPPAELRAALLVFTDEQFAMGYDLARDEIYGVNGGTGIDLHDGLYECVYTGRTLTPDGTTYPKGTCTLLDGSSFDNCSFNTEHTWPSSQLVPSHDPTGRGDLHHIFPSWATANNQRGDFPFGVPTCTPPNCTWQADGSYRGKNANGDWVFFVRLATRGDVARAQFYMSVRYQMPIAETVEQVLRQWHADDPVDLKEFTRNNAIEAVQLNRNPFVDRPDFVDLIPDF